MAFADDIAGDFEVFDGTETVTLDVGDDDPISVAGVIKRSVTYREAVVNGTIGAGGEIAVFELPSENMEGKVIVDASKITDANSVVWSVQSANFDDLLSKWVCPCTAHV